MLPVLTLRLTSLLAAAWLFLQAPASQGSFEPLKQTIGLSDAQLTQLQRDAMQRRREAAIRNSSQIVIDFPVGMDDAHKAALSEIAKVLERPGTAVMAIDIGLIHPEQWPGAPGSFCHLGLSSYTNSPYLADLGMTRSQIERLEQMMRIASAPLWAQVRDKSIQRQALLDSGARANSPAVIRLDADMNTLDKQIAAKPPHDVAISVLDSTQKAKLAEFERVLELAREAVELGLIFDPYLYGEVLCK